MESFKYLHNLIQMPVVAILFLAGTLLVLFGIVKTLLVLYAKGIWFTGLGTVLVVFSLFCLATHPEAEAKVVAEIREAAEREAVASAAAAAADTKHEPWYSRNLEEQVGCGRLQQQSGWLDWSCLICSCSQFSLTRVACAGGACLLCPTLTPV
jgi:hypothetical protein